jgi:hypothetical protein
MTADYHDKPNGKSGIVGQVAHPLAVGFQIVASG